MIYHYYYFGDRNGTGENSNKVALHYFRQPGSGRLRLDLRRRRACLQQASRSRRRHSSPSSPGPQGQAILRDGKSFEYTVGVGEAAHPQLEPLASLEAPIVDPSAFDARKVVELMAAAGLL